jgi:hypothetical protein
MSDQKHTRGEWVTDAEGFDVFVEGPDGGVEVAVMGRLPRRENQTPGQAGAERRANARLIAASPALLEACEALLSAWYADPADVEQMDKALELGRRAVAKTLRPVEPAAAPA